MCVCVCVCVCVCLCVSLYVSVCMFVCEHARVCEAKFKQYILIEQSVYNRTISNFYTKIIHYPTRDLQGRLSLMEQGITIFTIIHK